MDNKKYRILIADSDTRYRKLFLELLKELDVIEDVVFATDGLMALELIDKFKPNVVITELVISGCDGFAILDELSPDAISIICTDCGTQAALDNCKKYKHLAHVMLKPVRAIDVRKRLDEILNKNRRTKIGKGKRMSDEHFIHNLLVKCGVPVHLKGFRMIISACMRVSADPELIHSITSSLYCTVADEFDTTWIRVERNIRTAIEAAYNRGNIDFLNELFGFTIDARKGKPTNSEFIAMIADKVWLRGA